MLNRPSSSKGPRWRERLLGPCLGLASVLIAAPSAAVTLPDLPLQTGTAYPPANIMFILDDSGSMAWDFMPGAFGSGEVPATSPVNIALNTYARNTVYYNPAITYRPWVRADGSRYAMGSYTAAFSSTDGLSGAVDLSLTSRAFYVPKNDTADRSLTQSYYRYRIPAGAATIERAEYGAVSAPTQTVTGFPQTGLSGDPAGGTMQHQSSFTVPAGTVQLVVQSSGGTHGTNGSGSGGATNNNGDGANLYVNYLVGPTTLLSTCRSTGGDNSETCTINNPTPGVWYVALNADSRYKNVTLTASLSITNRCGTGVGSPDWINCTNLTPTGRSVAAELENYATWYSYHRTRMKVAKAGASEAFSQLGTNIRVGYDSIWNRSSGIAALVSNTATPTYPIPVDTDGGLFTGSNRSSWFGYLHAAQANGGTPLHGALRRAGRYFEDDTSTGPWGPGGANDQLSCRQNFALLTTDGYWNSGAGYGTSLGDVDGAAGARIDPKTPINASDFYQYSPQAPYTDNFATTPNARGDTLADVAMHYWKRDLRSLPNDVPKSTADPAFWQHMTTFGVSIGLQGRLDPKNDLSSIENGTKRWGDPMDAEDLDRIDDLWHASVNGRGTFVAAGNPTEFTQGLVNALTTVAERLGSASNVTANSTSFQTDTRVYQASYVSGSWSGEVAAYEVSSAGITRRDLDGDGKPDPAWRASTGIPAVADRDVFTWSGTRGAQFPTSGQETALARSTGLSPVSGSDNAAYIKGERRLEKANSGTLRNRSSLLGDIVNSSPAYSADSRTLFVGANDGMLHAITTVAIGTTHAAGAELFAYVPQGLDLAALASLSDPQYSHRWFVDGPIAVSTRTQTPGTNYLVGALGRGGKGVYGLDVTSPASFDDNDVLWDNTGNALGANMGHVLGEPLVVTLNDSANTKAVVVSNGVNSTSGRAVLFVLNLQTGAVIAELDTGVGSDNGLSAPRGADMNADGTVDYVYAGDLKGNVWKFDLNGAPGAWRIANGGSPMFVAEDAGGVRQPITGGVGLARDPSTGRTWVLFGSGSFMTAGDVSSSRIQSLYGVIDDGVVRRSDLEGREIEVTGEIAGKKVRAFEPHEALPGGRKGWFVDLDEPSPGERVITAPRVRGNVMLTASLIPPTGNSCEAGGSGYINAIDAFTGTSLREVYFDVDGDGNFDEELTGADGRSRPVGSVDLGVGMPTMPTIIDNLLIVGGSTGSLGSVGVNPQGGTPRRVSWHEVVRN